MTDTAPHSPHSQCNVISTNEKIFPIFLQKLSSKNMSEYITTADKLKTWLTSDKAYYTAARPKIVDLLEIALISFTDVWRHRENLATTAETLRELVGTVVPHIHTFVEGQLLARLLKIINDTEDILRSMHTPVEMRSTVQATSSHPTSVADAPSSNLVSSTSSTQVLETGVKPSVTPSDAPQAQRDSHHSMEAGPPSVPNLEISPSPTIDRSSVGDSPSAGSPTVPSVAPAKPQPKRTRAAELKQLIARDLDWYRSKVLAGEGNASSASALIQPPVPPVFGSAPPGGPSTIPSSPKGSPANITPSRDPQVVSRSSAQALAGATSVSTVLPEVGGEKSIPTQLSNAHQPAQEPDAAMADIRMNNIVSDAEKAVFPSKLPSVDTPSKSVVSSNIEVPAIEAPSTRALDESSLMDVDVSSAKSPNRGIASIMESHPASTERMVGTGQIRSPSVSHRDANPTAVEKNDATSLPRLQSPSRGKQVGSAVEMGAEVSSQTSPHQESFSEEKFGRGMVVVHSTWGLSFTHVHRATFNLSDMMFLDISRWANCKATPEGVPGSICLSLACYRLLDLYAVTQAKAANGDFHIADATTRVSCSWPSTGCLFLRLDSKDLNIPLSPPFMVTPEECVDLSLFVEKGENSVEISQYGDLSDYIFVIHAHHPTKPQLVELEKTIAANEGWRSFLKDLCTEIEIDGPREGSQAELS